MYEEILSLSQALPFRPKSQSKTLCERLCWVPLVDGFGAAGKCLQRAARNGLG